MSAALDAAREGLRGHAEAWVVGGAVRDRLLGRPVGDLDLVVAGPARTAARRIAVVAGGPAFELSGEFGAWRVMAPDRSWQVDVATLQGATLEEDLARRDFTLNAMAEPLHGGPLVDPHDGAGAVAARRLRMVAERSFDDDPLRVLRLARFACELGLAIEDPTRAAARERAPKVAGVAQERVFAELRRLVGAEDPADGLRTLDDLRLTPVVLPELDALHGVAQSRFHHRDVHGHTLEVLEAAVALDRDPGRVLGDAALGVRVAAWLAQPLADELTRGGALRWGALLHDAAKPQTQTVWDGATPVARGAEARALATAPGARVGFPGHDRDGADVARDCLTRLRASERLRAHVAALTRHHLRLGFLVREAPLSRRQVHDYLRACAPVPVDVTLLTVADRVATRGDDSERAIAAHLDLARTLLAAALDREDAGPQPPLVRGDELAAALGIAPGPALGPLLAELEAARYAGEVTTREAAIEHARRVLAAG